MSLALWLRSDRNITLASTKVSAWGDVSVNGNSLAQGTDANRPTYVNDGSGQRGRAYLDFTAASNTVLTTTSYSGWASGSGTYIAVVVDQTSVSGSQRFLQMTDAAAANTRMYLDGATGLGGKVYLGTTLESTGTTSATTGAQVIEMFRNSVTDKLELWVAGSRSLQSSALSVDTTGDTPVEMWIGQSAGGSVPYDGRIYEVVIANADPTNAQLAQLSDYWWRRYGLKGCSKLAA